MMTLKEYFHEVYGNTPLSEQARDDMWIVFAHGANAMMMNVLDAVREEGGHNGSPVCRRVGDRLEAMAAEYMPPPETKQ